MSIWKVTVAIWEVVAAKILVAVPIRVLSITILKELIKKYFKLIHKQQTNVSQLKKSIFMLKKLRNKLRMFKAVWQVLTTFRPVWETNVGFTEVTADLDGLLGDIDEARGQAGTNNSGITEDKNIMRDDLTDAIMELSGPFATMATRAGNNELKARVVFTDSGLDGLTEEELAKTGTSIAQLAVQHRDGLARYGVTPDEVASLMELATRYSAKIAEPREKTSLRVAAGDKLTVLFKETTQLLKDQLDGMVDKYRRTNPDFWNAYFNARKIVDYGIRHEDDEDNGEETKPQA
jgi:hypothetical protein